MELQDAMSLTVCLMVHIIKLDNEPVLIYQILITLLYLLIKARKSDFIIEFYMNAANQS